MNVRMINSSFHAIFFSKKSLSLASIYPVTGYNVLFSPSFLQIIEMALLWNYLGHVKSAIRILHCKFIF